MNLLFEISFCDKVDPEDMFEFLKDIIEDLSGECEVKVVRGKVVK